MRACAGSISAKGSASDAAGARAGWRGGCAPGGQQMSMAPRLDLRQSQSLVMTPQLRQAIKLLQSSNLEVVAFVEEELERNPLLERDERTLLGPDSGLKADPLPAAPAAPDSHAAAVSDSLPGENAGPLDAEWDNVYDAGGGYESPYGR